MFKIQTKRFNEKNRMPKGKKRKKNNSGGDMYEYCAIQNIKGGSFWTHDTDDCRSLWGFRKQRQRATQNMTKIEFHTLVNTLIWRFIKGTNKDHSPKKAKNYSNISATWRNGKN